ncbi:MAG: hypothetical protein JEZ03_06110 [Bacteroidales bacterium]|nr:hypothetical protein [Bacteroidales bacterium]
MMILKLMLVSIVLVAIAFLAINIKMFVKKGGMFTKSCSSVETDDGKKVGCTCSSSSSADHTKCENYETHHGNQIRIKDIKILTK